MRNYFEVMFHLLADQASGSLLQDAGVRKRGQVVLVAGEVAALDVQLELDHISEDFLVQAQGALEEAFAFDPLREVPNLLEDPVGISPGGSRLKFNGVGHDCRRLDLRG